VGRRAGGRVVDEPGARHAARLRRSLADHPAGRLAHRRLARPGAGHRPGLLRDRIRVDDSASARAGTARGIEGGRGAVSVAPSLDAAVDALCGDLRTIRAPRGAELNARSWATEAPLRMLLNNLDREAVEWPEDLVVYGGSGKAARSHDALRAIVGALLELGTDETLLVQSGKPVGVFRTHPRAPRVL